MTYKPYGPRGWALLALAYIAGNRGWRWLAEKPPGNAPPWLVQISEVIPATVWGILWLIVPVLCIWSAFRKRQGLGLAAFCGMAGAWAFAYITSAVAYTGTRQALDLWLSAGGYLAAFVVVLALARMLNPVQVGGDVRGKHE